MSGAPAAGEGELPRVFVMRRLPGDALSRLEGVAEVDAWSDEEPPARREVLRRAAAVQGLVPVVGDRVDAELLEACRELVVVSSLGVGYDHVDVAELTRRRIPLGNTPGVLTEATADLTWCLLLALARRLVEGRAAVLDGSWKRWDPGFLLGRELSGSTLGIVGLGRIGQAVARRALAFNLEVLAFSPRAREVPGVACVPLPELLERAGFVSLHVPLDASTFHLVGAAELSRMRPDAYLINTARGAVVDQQALLVALQEGWIAGAGLDVAEVEPVPTDDPLLQLENCLVLPHLGSATLATRARMADLVVDNLLAGLAGERLPHCVNPEVYAS